VTIGFLASATRRPRFGTGISLIAQRNPIYTAKEFATLDWLSGGRVDLGVDRLVPLIATDAVVAPAARLRHWNGSRG